MTITNPTDRIDTAERPAAGTWQIDPSHTTIGCWVRHLAISKVRGRFTSFSGTAYIDDEHQLSRISVTIDAASIDTANGDRDDHLRSEDFLDVANHPTVTFNSTGVAHDGRSWSVHGDLTMRGVTLPVVLATEYHGTVTDPDGDVRALFTATTVIDRTDFGMTFNQAVETGGVLVGNKLHVELEVQLVHVPVGG